MSDGVSLTRGAAARMARAVRGLEAGRPPGGEASARLSEQLLVARCTGAISSGLYPGVITVWNDETSAWVDYAAVKLKVPNSETLASGTRYLAEPVAQLASGELLLLAFGHDETRIVYRGKLDGALSAGGSATMSIWEYSGGSEADTGNNITVYDWLLASGSIASGKKVVALYDGASGRHYVVAAECP